MSQHHTPSTDETVPALDLSDRTDSLPTRDGVAHTHRRAHRLVVAAVALAIVAGGVGAVALGRGSSTTSTAGATPVVTGLPGAVNTGVEVADPAPNGAPQGDQGQPQPEPQPPAEPGVLKVSKSVINLPDGVYQGSFEVSNEGGSPISWHWLAGDFGIGVSESGGTLAPGETTVVVFTINPFQVPEGEFLFANCIFNDEVAKDLKITGYRTPIVVNPNIPQGPPNIKP